MRGRDEASGREAGAGLHDKAGDGHGQAESLSLRGLWQGPVPARRRVGARGPVDDARRGADGHGGRGGDREPAGVMAGR